jgi:hypothetical protein
MLGERTRHLALLAGAALFFVGLTAGVVRLAQSYNLPGEWLEQYGYIDGHVQDIARNMLYEGIFLVFLGAIGGAVAVLSLLYRPVQRPVQRPIPSEPIDYSLLPMTITCPDCGAMNVRTDNLCRNCEKDLGDIKRTLAQSATEVKGV